MNTNYSYGHAVPIDPDSGCGISGRFFEDVHLGEASICSTIRIAEFWGIL